MPLPRDDGAGASRCRATIPVGSSHRTPHIPQTSRGTFRTLLQVINQPRQDEQVSDLPPEDDPVLRPIWVDMSPDERLAYLLAELETPPARLTEAAQQKLADERDT